MNNQKYKVLDLFSGAGGFSLGFKKFHSDGSHPFEIVGAIEKDKYAVDTLISSMIRQGMSEEEARRRVINNDITFEITKQKIYEVCPEVDIIIGGPPCQSFSIIGPRSGSKEKQEKFANDDRDFLFEHYIEILEHYKPIFFVFENVRGIISKNDTSGRRYIDIIAECFENIGYTLLSEDKKIKQKYLVLNAADYGVPQLRERVFIIGNRLNVDNPCPKKTHCPPESVAELGLLPYVTLRDAIGDLPEVFPKITLTPLKKGISIKYVSLERKNKIDMRNKHRNNGNDRAPYHWESFNTSYNDGDINRKKYLDFIKPLNKQFLLTGHIARGQQHSDIILFKGMNEGMSSKQLTNSDIPRHKFLASLIKYKMNSFKDKYKKLSWDKPCNTVFAHMQKDGNRFIHPDSRQGRTLTVRETARIQSFPDDYIFEAPGNVRYKYIGNAVPPLLAMALARAIYNAMTINRHRFNVFEVYRPNIQIPDNHQTDIYGSS